MNPKNTGESRTDIDNDSLKTVTFSIFMPMVINLLVLATYLLTM